MRTIGRLGARGRTIIPRVVRERLGLRAGDSLAYELDADGTVRLRRLPAPDLVAYLRAVQATLGEWDDPEDDAAYADL